MIAIHWCHTIDAVRVELLAEARRKYDAGYTDDATQLIDAAAKLESALDTMAALQVITPGG